jgi:hypothetical protein
VSTKANKHNHDSGMRGLAWVFRHSIMLTQDQTKNGSSCDSDEYITVNDSLYCGVCRRSN